MNFSSGWSEWTAMAKSTLKSAQKQIDKVLDINDDDKQKSKENVSHESIANSTVADVAPADSTTHGLKVDDFFSAFGLNNASSSTATVAQSSELLKQQANLTIKKVSDWFATNSSTHEIESDHQLSELQSNSSWSQWLGATSTLDNDDGQLKAKRFKGGEISDARDQMDDFSSMSIGDDNDVGNNRLSASYSQKLSYCDLNLTDKQEEGGWNVEELTVPLAPSTDNVFFATPSNIALEVDVSDNTTCSAMCTPAAAHPIAFNAQMLSPAIEQLITPGDQPSILSHRAQLALADDWQFDECGSFIHQSDENAKSFLENNYGSAEFSVLSDAMNKTFKDDSHNNNNNNNFDDGLSTVVDYISHTPVNLSVSSDTAGTTDSDSTLTTVIDVFGNNAPFAALQHLPSSVGQLSSSESSSFHDFTKVTAASEEEFVKENIDQEPNNSVIASIVEQLLCDVVSDVERMGNFSKLCSVKHSLSDSFIELADVCATANITDVDTADTIKCVDLDAVSDDHDRKSQHSSSSISDHTPCSNVKSSCCTSPIEELETPFSSSDIEVLSNATGNGETYSERGFVIMGSTGEFSPIRHLISDKYDKNREHRRVSSDQSSICESMAAIQAATAVPSDSKEILARKLIHLMEVVEAREMKLLELSRENVQLADDNQQLRSELNTLITQHDNSKAAELQLIIKERDSLKSRCTMLQAELPAKEEIVVLHKHLQEKQDEIEQLMKEGENLSKRELKQSNVIKKLRDKEKETEKILESQKFD